MTGVQTCALPISQADGWLDFFFNSKIFTINVFIHMTLIFDLVIKMVAIATKGQHEDSNDKVVSMATAACIKA